MSALHTATIIRYIVKHLRGCDFTPPTPRENVPHNIEGNRRLAGPLIEGT